MLNSVTESIFIRALKRQDVERTPVWMMRQAGRYLPEYRQVRQQAGSFLNLCKTPELACEVTLQPLRRYKLDAAIVFSDILTIPDAMGLGLHFIEGEGPCFAQPLHSIQSIHNLPVPSTATDLTYVTDTIRLVRESLPTDVPLIGFSGSPWTLACYMVEGKSSRDFQRVLRLMYESPEIMHLLLSKITSAVSDYLAAQIHAGANAAMIFDTWGGLLSTPYFLNFSLGYMRQIVNELKRVYPEIPIILFTKGGALWLDELADSGCDALSLDWTCDLGKARKLVGDRVALQGNLDPTVLLTSGQCIRKEVKRVLESYGKGNGHVFNLGHGITPDVPPEHVQIMIEAIQEYSPEYHCNVE